MHFEGSGSGEIQKKQTGRGEKWTTLNDDGQWSNGYFDTSSTYQEFAVGLATATHKLWPNTCPTFRRVRNEKPFVMSPTSILFPPCSSSAKKEKETLDNSIVPIALLRPISNSHSELVSPGLQRKFNTFTASPFSRSNRYCTWRQITHTQFRYQNSLLYPAIFDPISFSICPPLIFFFFFFCKSRLTSSFVFIFLVLVLRNLLPLSYIPIKAPIFFLFKWMDQGPSDYAVWPDWWRLRLLQSLFLRDKKEKKRPAKKFLPLENGRD